MNSTLNKTLQGFIEGRIQDIESKLSLCQVVDISQMPEGDRVIFGSTVTIINTETDEELSYRIVGDDEADVKAGMISYQSPIAREQWVIGKKSYPL